MMTMMMMMMRMMMMMVMMMMMMRMMMKSTFRHCLFHLFSPVGITTKAIVNNIMLKTKEKR